MKDEGKQTLTPKLRFPEFREAWEVNEIGDYLAESRIVGSDGFAAKKITVKLWGKGVFEKVESLKGSENTQYYKRRAGQFIYSKLDFLNQAFGIIPEHLDGFESTVDLPCFDVSKTLNSRFLVEYVQRPNFYKKHGDMADGGRKAKRIQVESFLGFPIAVPSLAEQHKIADCLTSLDEMIAAHGRKLALLRDHKSGLMQQLFPREGETLPRLRFTDAGEWKEKAFEALYDFKPTNSFSRDQLNYEAGSVRNIHYGDIHTKFAASFHLTREQVPFVNPSVLPGNIRDEAFCRPGDMIFADASEDLADVGKSIEVIDVNGEKVLSGSHTILARPKDSAIAVGFGAYLFKSRSVRAQIEKEAQGTKVMAISPTRLAGIRVRYPMTPAEQQRIAACLNSLDARLAAEAEKLAALKAHKKGLMQQLFPSPEGV